MLYAYYYYCTILKYVTVIIHIMQNAKLYTGTYSYTVLWVGNDSANTWVLNVCRRPQVLTKIEQYSCEIIHSQMCASKRTVRKNRHIRLHLRQNRKNLFCTFSVCLLSQLIFGVNM